MRNSRPLVFSIRSYVYLQKELLKLTGYESGEVDVKQFPDGERYQRLMNSVQERDVVVMGGTTSDTDTLELFDLASAAVMQGASSLTLLIPYFGYSTMERAVKTGEVVTAKTRARLLSAIPQGSVSNRIALLDLHTEGLPYYFEGSVRTDHLYAKEVIIRAARKLCGDQFVLACTDAGRAKWVESLANDLGVQASFVFKKREDGESTTITAVSAWVKDQDVIIYDDMIRTGGSMIKAAQAYLNAGARSISAITTHGIFPNKGLERLRESGIFQQIVTTDSHPNALKLEDDFLEVVSVAEVFAAYLQEHF